MMSGHVEKPTVKIRKPENVYELDVSDKCHLAWVHYSVKLKQVLNVIPASHAQKAVELVFTYRCGLSYSRVIIELFS